MNDSLTATVELTTVRDAAVAYHFEIFRGRTGLTAIRDDWSEITQGLNNLPFFQHYEWYESYLDTLAESDSSILFVLARHEDLPVGVVPLVQANRKIVGLKLRSVELPQHSHMLLSDGIFARSGSNEAMMRRLIAYLRSQSEIAWDVAVFPNLIEDGCIHSALKTAPPGWLISETHARCDYIPCIPFNELSTKFSRNFRGSLRKARNKLMNLGGVEYVSARRWPELGQALDEFLDVEASGWKGASGERSAIKLDVRLTNFYRSLCETFSQIDACEINLLKVDGHCVAGQFCLIAGDTSYVLKIGYDESYAHLAPGNMLLEHSLRRYEREGIVRYLNLVTDTPWHGSWKPLSYPVWNGYVFNTTPVGLAAFTLLHGKLYLRGRYKAQFKLLVEQSSKFRHSRSPDRRPEKKESNTKEDGADVGGQCNERSGTNYEHHEYA